jgi:hypothetical protein
VTGTVAVREGDRVLEFSSGDVLRFHGGGSPGGAALAYKVLERALPLLAGPAPCERRVLVVRSAFDGPGARDAFELVTRAVSEGRFRLDAALRRPELGPARERFVFTVEHAGSAVTLTLREGFVTDEFAALAFAAHRDEPANARLQVLKRELAERVLAQPAESVFDVA